LVRTALVLAVCVALLVQPVAADAPVDPESLSDDRFEFETVDIDDTNDSVDVTVEYDVPLSVKVDVYLFGSGSLEETVLERLGLEPADARFDRLDTSSAELSYDGEPDELEALEG